MRMSYKKLSVVFLSVFAVAGVIFYFQAMKFPEAMGPAASSPTFYPKLLSVLMTLFSVVGIITTLKKEDKIIEIPSIKNYFFVLVVTIVWVFAWQNLGYFYLVSAIGVGVMLYYLNSKPNSLTKIRNTLLIDAGIIAFVYAVFDKFLNVSL